MLNRLTAFSLGVIFCASLLLGGAQAYFYGGSGTFQPSNIPNLALDLDARKGITLDTSVTPNAVSTWANQAPTGSAYNATQATQARMPVLQVDPYSGEPELLFDGTDDRLGLSGTGLNLARNVPGLTIFYVYIPLTPTGNPRTPIDIRGSGVWDQRLSYFINHSPQGQRGFQATQPSYTELYENSVNTNDYTTETVRLDVTTNPNKLDFWWNDVKRVDNANFTTTTGGLLPNSASNTILIGALNFGGTIQWFANMRVKRILVYQRALSDAEIRTVQNYLYNEHYNRPVLDYFVFAGDSNTFGLGISPTSDNVPNKFKTLADANPWPVPTVVDNGGVSGQLMRDTLAYWEAVDRQLSRRKFPYARNRFIMLGSGTNDVGQLVDNGATAERYREFGQFYSALGFKCVLWTTLPNVNMTSTINDLRDRQLANYTIWGFLGITNSHTLVGQPTIGDMTAGGDFQGDGVHLTAQGANKMATGYRSTVKTLLGIASLMSPDRYATLPFYPTQRRES